MTGTEGTENQGPKFRVIDMSELVDEVIADLRNPENPESEEASEFVKNMEEKMHEGEMTEETAETIAAAFALLFQFVPSDQLRQDFGHALNELTETNSQHAKIFGGCAEHILMTSIVKMMDL